MRLADLQIPDLVRRGGADVGITHLTADSRSVRPGSLFAALPGTTTHGARFIDQAIAAGAVAVLGEPELLDRQLPVPMLVATDARRAWSLLAAQFVDKQPATVVAVTGTNGKTSTVTFVRQIWRAAGLGAASLGTLGVDGPSGQLSGSLTTPEPVTLHEWLAELADGGVTHLAMEASSHGLEQRRLDGVRLNAGAFLNITRDHLDYHGSFDAYLAAKRRLFDTLLPEGAAAILNADTPFFGELADVARERGLRVVEVGREAKDLRLLGRRPSAAGQELQLRVHGQRETVWFPVVGAFQAENLVAALALAITTGVDPQTALAAVPSINGPRGRMEMVGSHPNGAGIFVDYAHTPDALEHALYALRAHCRGRLVVVFGCGGDRDRGKRPQMGRIAVTKADRVIVTDDNPRTEDAGAIRQEVLAGCPDAQEIGDRAEAIATGIRCLRGDDVLLIAGKGHETGQIVGRDVLPFDDASVAREVLERAGAKVGAAA